jgi:hypothetical protein
MPKSEADYALQEIDDNHWKVHKFEAHHGNWEIAYNVKKGANGWYCDCKAVYGCKHIAMVRIEINPKKSLF